jgi:hypothetical protein
MNIIWGARSEIAIFWVWRGLAVSVLYEAYKGRMCEQHSLDLYITVLTML